MDTEITKIAINIGSSTITTIIIMRELIKNNIEKADLIKRMLRDAITIVALENSQTVAYRKVLESRIKAEEISSIIKNLTVVKLALTLAI